MTWLKKGQQIPDIKTLGGGPSHEELPLTFYQEKRIKVYLLDLNRQLPRGAQAEHLGLPNSRVDGLQRGISRILSHICI